MYGNMWIDCYMLQVCDSIFELFEIWLMIFFCSVFVVFYDLQFLWLDWEYLQFIVDFLKFVMDIMIVDLDIFFSGKLVFIEDVLFIFICWVYDVGIIFSCFVLLYEFLDLEYLR